MTCKVKLEPEISLADQRKYEGQISWLASTFFDRELLAYARYDMSGSISEIFSKDCLLLIFQRSNFQSSVPKSLVQIRISLSHSLRGRAACFGLLRMLKRLPAASDIRLALGTDVNADGFSEPGMVFELTDVCERRKFGMVHVAGKEMNIKKELINEWQPAPMPS